MTNRPSVIKSAVLASASALAAAWLVGVSTEVGLPASASPGDVMIWLEFAETPAVVIGIVRSIGVAITAYLSVVGSLGVLAGVTGTRGAVAATWRLVSTDATRRILVAGTIAALMSNSLPAQAAVESTPIVMVDLGPAPILDDDPTPAQIRPDPFMPLAPEQKTWIVAPGDHLWRIAEDTLRSDGEEPSMRDTTRYWRRLIAENFSTAGADPDLIHPGRILTLPPR